MENLEIKQDWDNDGMLVISNAKTIKHYIELKKELDECDIHKFDMFFAYNNKQFDEGLNSIRPLAEGESIYEFGQGAYGTKDGIDKYVAFCKNVKKRIAEECDPQEVYCYEFNNYESFIAYDGDANVIRLIAEYWGWDIAAKIRRYSKFYDIEDLKSWN